MSTPIDELWNNTWKYDSFDQNVMDLIEKIEFLQVYGKRLILENSDGPPKTLKTFAKFKTIYLNFVYNKGLNYNFATLENVEYKCVKSEVIH